MKAKKYLALIIVLFIGSMASAQDILPRKAPHDDKTKDTAVVYGTTQPFFVPEIGEQIAEEFRRQDYEDEVAKGINARRGRDTHYKINYYLFDVYRLPYYQLDFLPIFDFQYYESNKQAFIRDRKGILAYLQKDYRRIVRTLAPFTSEYLYLLTYESQIKIYKSLCKKFLGNGTKNIQRTKSVQRGGKSRSTRQGRRK